MAKFVKVIEEFPLISFVIQFSYTLYKIETYEIMLEYQQSDEKSSAIRFRIYRMEVDLLITFLNRFKRFLCALAPKLFSNQISFLVSS